MGKQKKEKKKGMIILPESELQIMLIIWDMAKESGGSHRHITAGAMLSKYPEVIGHLKLTTVLTLISRLINKGFICSEHNGRANFYIPLVDETEYKRIAAADFVATVYKNDAKSLITALFNDSSLTSEDVAELKKMINVKDDE